MTRKLSGKAHYKKWEESLANLQKNQDPARTCRTIMWLTGTHSSTIFAEPLLPKDQIFTINEGKTNVFMKEHAAVNRLCFNKQRKGTHPAAEIYSEIVDGGRKLLFSLSRGGT